MSTLYPVYQQYRTFDHVYLFKTKSDESQVLKIFDLSQKCLYKNRFSTRDLRDLSGERIFIKGNIAVFLKTLVQSKLLPAEYFPESPIQPTPSDCLQMLAQTIEQFKPRVCVKIPEAELLECPITLDPFQDPVMDEHGHTFEKSAIEKHLETSKECPINRQPINSLTPNRLVKQTIEEWQRREPIPTFSLFQEEDLELAASHLKMVQIYVQKEKYDEALEAYSKAFQYSKKSSAYLEVPLVFKKLKAPEKATLAYLYLAQYQLEEEEFAEAIQTLENCRKGKPAHLHIDHLLIKLYLSMAQPEKAKQLIAIQSAEGLSNQSREQAITVYQQSLNHYPLQYTLYSCLAKLIDSPQKKVQVLLKGVLHALEQKENEIASRLCAEASKHSEDSFVDQLVLSNLLGKQQKSPDLQQRLVNFANLFEKGALVGPMLQAYKMAYQIEKRPEYCQKIIKAYEELHKPQKQIEWYTANLSLLLEREEWSQAEKIARDALVKVDEAHRIAIYEKLEIVYSHWHGHQLKELWNDLGKAYQTQGQLVAAEKSYRKAFESFHGFDQAIALGAVLVEQGKTHESVHAYYEATAEALLDQNNEKLALCCREIRKIDPRLEQLDVNQRIHLLTQSHILRLSEELKESNQRIVFLEQMNAIMHANNSPDKEEKTPFHLAAQKGYLEAMKYLHSLDPSLHNEEDDNGETPFHAAASNGHTEALKYLHSLDPSLHNKTSDTGWTPFHEAAYNGHMEAMKYLHSLDSSLHNKEDDTGWTPFHAAASGGHTEAMKYLHSLDHTLHNEEDGNGETPFHAAASGGHTEAMKYLHSLDHTLHNEEGGNGDGETPFDKAASNGHTEAMKYLHSLDHTLHNKEDGNGETPF
ncbi:MAG: hypothetical protein K940chlam7_01939, partial [Chlamydiae bacterium]|nr:hypothetical protein [Chlamydiota bacterium]